MFQKVIAKFLLVLLVVGMFGAADLKFSQKAEAGYDPSGLCSDGAFVNWASLDANGIQAFLSSKSSFLRNFSENGRSAARIIYDAARDNKINPIAILATIQKEEGIVYGSNATSYNQTRVDWAMGYGYTDSVIYTKYKGFTNQVEYGTWQLRRNYDYWATNGSEWNVGKTMLIDTTNVTFKTKCTSALYRYTPHMGGNYNFNYYFNAWGGEATYSARYWAQGPYTGAGSYGSKIKPNETFTIWISLRNTGSATWYRKGVTPIHLGTSGPQDRTSAFLGDRNLRGYLVQSSVAPGGIGTFKLRMRAPLQTGVYVEKFRPVVEYVGWLEPEINWTLNVTTSGANYDYKSSYVAQGPYSGPGSYGSPLDKGESVTLWVSFRNTGRETWVRMGDNPTHLGVSMPHDRKSPFLNYRDVRGLMVQNTVAPGQIGTFKIRVKAPTTAGNYYERFQLVTEYVSWFGPTVEWPLTVR